MSNPSRKVAGKGLLARKHSVHCCQQYVFAALENELSPTCVVKPENEADVSVVIKTVRTYREQVHLAIKGGGHTPWAGAANIENGITVDMQSVIGVNVNARTGIASVGAGEPWANVHEQLDAQGTAVAGGRASKVRVGGLISGGSAHIH